MGVNRITSGFLNNQATYYLSTNLSLLSDIQQKISSGKNINRPSDDPVGLTRILNLSNTLRTDSRYARNIQNALAEVNTADKALTNMVDLIHRAQELTTQAANFTNNQDGRNAIALEIDQIISQLVQLGNTDIGGKYIFGGMVTDTPPFARTGPNSVIYTGSPSGTGQRNVEISRGVELGINTNGLDLLGQAVGAYAVPGVSVLPPVFNAGSGGLFQTLIELKLDLEADPAVMQAPNQLEEIRNRLDDLTTGMNTVLARQAVVGSVSNRLELTQGRIDERKSTLTQQYASIQDINLPETIANLNHQQNVFEASLGVTARIMQTSLLDYLR